jgi:anti-anti-sigma factor
MTVPLHRDGDIVRAKCAGTMTFHDHQAGDEMLAALDAMLDKAGITQVRFDLSEVAVLDSYWLSVFIRALRRIRMAGARLVMERPQPDVRRLFSLVELDRVLEIAD